MTKASTECTFVLVGDGCYGYDSGVQPTFNTIGKFPTVCGCGFEYPSRQYVNPSSHKRRGNKLKTRPGQRTHLSACPFGTGRKDFFARGHLIMVNASILIIPTGA